MISLNERCLRVIAGLDHSVLYWEEICYNIPRPPRREYESIYEYEHRLTMLIKEHACEILATEVF